MSMKHLREIAEESGVDLDAEFATSNEKPILVDGYPEPISTWYQENDIWKPWKAFIKGHGTFSGWSAMEAALAAASHATA